MFKRTLQNLQVKTCVGVSCLMKLTVWPFTFISGVISYSFSFSVKFTGCNLAIKGIPLQFCQIYFISVSPVTLCLVLVQPYQNTKTIIIWLVKEIKTSQWFRAVLLWNSLSRRKKNKKKTKQKKNKQTNKKLQGKCQRRIPI